MGFNTVEGKIDRMAGAVTFGPAGNIPVSCDISLPVSRINTENESRDEHLLKPDFFDAAAYPNIRFQSQSIQSAGEGFSVDGKLTLRGVTRQVSIPIKAFPTGLAAGIGIVYTGTFRINRLDYGIATDTGTLMVGNEVEIDIYCVVEDK